MNKYVQKEYIDVRFYGQQPRECVSAFDGLSQNEKHVF